MATETKDKKSIGILLFVLVLLTLGGGWYWMKKKKEKEEAEKLAKESEIGAKESEEKETKRYGFPRWWNKVDEDGKTKEVATVKGFTDGIAIEVEKLKKSDNEAWKAKIAKQQSEGKYKGLTLDQAYKLEIAWLNGGRYYVKDYNPSYLPQALKK